MSDLTITVQPKTVSVTVIGQQGPAGPPGQDGAPGTGGGSASGEETEFTPLLKFGGGDTGLTYASRSGKACKIGNRVDFTIDVQLSTKGTSTGALTISDLPYTAARTNIPVFVEQMTGITGTVHGLAADGTTTISLYQLNGGAASPVTDANVTNSSRITLSGTYFIGVVPPQDGMALGMNLAGLTSFDGAYPFANLCWNSGPWALMSGTATFTQNQGTLTVSSVTGTAVFQLWLSDNGNGLPIGSYTLLNPNGHSVGVSPTSGGSPTYTGGYVSATSTAFSYTSGGMFLVLQVTAPGTYQGMAVILPSHEVSWEGGDYFSSAFVSYHQTMKPPVLRMMDWGRTNYTIDTDWSDRALMGKTTLATPSGYDAQAPWELMIAAANRLGKDIWINVPVRATQAYINSLAALFAANLSPTLKVYVETGNEIWNTSGGFAAGYNWVQFINHTKLAATVDAATGIVTRAAHGLTTGAIVNGFVTRATREKYLFDSLAGTNYYVACRGHNAYVEVLTPDTFRVYADVARTLQVPFRTGVTDWIYVEQAEPGRSMDVDANFATLHVRNVAAFDAAMGASRVKSVMASHAANTGRTSARIATAFAAAARVDHLAIGPYFYPVWLGAAVDIVSGQFTPKAWSNCGSTNVAGSMSVHFCVYAAGSTPTVGQLLAGTGTGFIAKQTFSQAYTGATYTSGTAVTGLVNGTNYKVYFVFIDPNGYRHILSNTISPSATASTSVFTDSYANQALRCISSIDHPTTGALKRVDDHLAAIAASSIPTATLVNYEGGMHLDEAAPTDIANWMINFTEDAAFGDVLTRYMRALSARGEKVHCVFSDVSTKSLSWSTADSYSDTGDQRFIALSGFGGLVVKRTPLSLADVTGNTIENDPNNFPTPTTLATFANASLTYSILKGNDDDNYQITGNTLQMIGDTGINWSAPTLNSLTIWGRDSFLDELFQANFTTGSSWYEGDALYAWNSTTDLSNTQINPESGRGNALAIANGGPGATISGGLWNLNATTYTSSTGLASSIDLSTKGMLVAIAIHNAADAGNFVGCLQIGSGAFVQVYKSGGFFKWRFHNGTVDTLLGNLIAPDTTLRVFWLFYDQATGKLHYGYNQTETNTNGSAGETPSFTIPATIARDTTTGTRSFTIGSIEVVNRAGLTLTQAKAMVQKLQTLHGI